MNATTKCVTLAIVAISHAGPLPVSWHLYIHHSLLDIRSSNPHCDAQQTHDTPHTLNPTELLEVLLRSRQISNIEQGVTKDECMQQ